MSTPSFQPRSRRYQLQPRASQALLLIGQRVSLAAGIKFSMVEEIVAVKHRCVVVEEQEVHLPHTAIGSVEAVK